MTAMSAAVGQIGGEVEVWKMAAMWKEFDGGEEGTVLIREND